MSDWKLREPGNHLEWETRQLEFAREGRHRGVMFGVYWYDGWRERLIALFESRTLACQFASGPGQLVVALAENKPGHVAPEPAVRLAQVEACDGAAPW